MRKKAIFLVTLVCSLVFLTGISFASTEKDTGTVLFSTTDDTGLFYNGSVLEEIKMENKELKNWIIHNEIVLATVLDKVKNTTSLSLYKDGQFEILIDNFDIVGTINFDGKIYIHGLDREYRENKLWVFDGESLNLVQNDFLMGSYIEFKDKLIINKYDKYRQYSIVVIPKGSAKTQVISTNDIIFQDYLIQDEQVFLTGVSKKGQDKPLAVLSFNEEGKAVLDIIDQNCDFKFSDENLHAFWDNKLFYIKGKDLYVVDKNRQGEFFSNKYMIDREYIKAKYVVNFEDRLFIASTGLYGFNGKTTDSDDNIIEIFKDDKDKYYKTVFDYTFSVDNIYLTNKYLIFQGRDTSTRDNMLIAYNGNNKLFANDVFKIYDIVDMNHKLYFYVDDKNRITDKKQKSLLLFDGRSFKNIYNNISLKNITNQSGGLVLEVKENDTNMSKINRYFFDFETIIPDITSKLWKETKDSVLFVSGKETQSKAYQIYYIKNRLHNHIATDLEAKDVLAIKYPYYLIYAKDNKKGSKTRYDNNLYLYNIDNNSLELIASDLDLKNFLYVEPKNSIEIK